MENQIVIFEIGQEHFGVDIALVESIIKVQPITRLPHTPEFVEGVINLRGKVLPVIDLRKRFGCISIETHRESRIIVVRADQTEVGMVVDAVSEVLSVPTGAVEPVPALTATVDSRFIKGIATLGANGSFREQAGRLIILLDLTQVLSVQEQNTMETAFTL